jgi:hypothetical protein
LPAILCPCMPLPQAAMRSGLQAAIFEAAAAALCCVSHRRLVGGWLHVARQPSVQRLSELQQPRDTTAHGRG